MANIYWPVYKNLESEFSELMFNIHIDDNQLAVYSLRISDLVLRAAVEIESIAKDLYNLNGGSKTSYIKYDEDAIKHLNKLWKLDKKVVIISSPNCFVSTKLIYPFVKDKQRTGSERLTYGWNDAYQNIKHNRAENLRYGNLRYLFDIMAALFILNIYYKDETISLEKDSKATTFPIGLGSNIFSISLHKWAGYTRENNEDKYVRRADFDECLYLTQHTDESRENFRKAQDEVNEKSKELFLKHPKFKKFLEEGRLEGYKGMNLMWDVLGQEDYIKLLQQSSPLISKATQQTEYEAVLNKNNI